MLEQEHTQCDLDIVGLKDQLDEGKGRLMQAMMQASNKQGMKQW